MPRTTGEAERIAYRAELAYHASRATGCQELIQQTERRMMGKPAGDVRSAAADADAVAVQVALMDMDTHMPAMPHTRPSRRVCHFCGVREDGFGDCGCGD